MALFSNLHLFKVQTLENILVQSGAPKVAKLWQFSQGHPKAAFCEKVQTGDQGKFLKNRPKSRPRLKRLKALSRQWDYPLIKMHLKSEDWKGFWRKQRLQKCPNG